MRRWEASVSDRKLTLFTRNNVIHWYFTIGKATSICVISFFLLFMLFIFHVLICFLFCFLCQWCYQLLATCCWQIYDVLNNAGLPCGVKSVCLFGGTSKQPQISSLDSGVVSCYCLFCFLILNGPPLFLFHFLIPYSTFFTRYWVYFALFYCCFLRSSSSYIFQWKLPPRFSDLF